MGQGQEWCLQVGKGKWNPIHNQIIIYTVLSFYSTINFPCIQDYPHLHAKMVENLLSEKKSASSDHASYSNCFISVSIYRKSSPLNFWYSLIPFPLSLQLIVPIAVRFSFSPLYRNCPYSSYRDLRFTNPMTVWSYLVQKQCLTLLIITFFWNPLLAWHWLCTSLSPFSSNFTGHLSVAFYSVNHFLQLHSVTSCGLTDTSPSRFICLLYGDYSVFSASFSYYYHLNPQIS